MGVSTQTTPLIPPRSSTVAIKGTKQEYDTCDESPLPVMDVELASEDEYSIKSNDAEKDSISKQILNLAVPALISLAIGKSAFVLFYLVNACVQYKVSAS